MSKDSTCYYHKVIIKLQQNRSYAITNTPEHNQDFYIWRMPEHDAAIQLNLAPSRQEVMYQMTI